SGERQKNIVADLPKNYGKPPAWRFTKKSTTKTPSVAEGDATAEPPGDDLGAIPREELRTVIRKCHQTLWEGGKRSPIAAFEEFFGSFFKSDFGQYFTLRELIAFCVHLLVPEKSHLILDPACGSGGFLLHSLDFMRYDADRLFPEFETDANQKLEHFRHWHDF